MKNSSEPGCKRYIATVLILLIVIYTLLFSYIAALRYRSFSFHDIDLALLNQTFWNTIHGNVVGESVGQATILNGGHVFFIIFLLAPLYALFSSPLTLLFLQSLALALGVWPVYLLGKELLKPSFGLLFSICYLIYPALNWVTMFEFHPIAFATPLLLFMFYFYVRKQWWLFCIFMILALSCREDVAIPVFAMGVFALIKAWQERGKEGGKASLKWGLLPLFSALLWFIICVKGIQPHFKPVMLKGDTEALQGGLAFYSWLGNSLGEVITTIVMHPGRVLHGVLVKPKMLYLFQLFAPVAFLSVFSPSALVMVLLSLSEGLLSQRFAHFGIHYQYSSIITPAIFISAMYGVRNLLQWKVMAGKGRFIAAAIVLFSLASAKTMGPLFDLPGGVRQWKVTQEDRIREKLVRKIPPQIPVIATFEFAPQLSMRPQLFYFYHVYSVSRNPGFRDDIPVAQEASRYALIDFNDFLTFYDFYTPGGDRDVYSFLSEGGWQLLETVNSMALFKKGQEAELGLVEIAYRGGIEHPLNLVPIPQLRLSGYSLHQVEVMGERVIGLDVYLKCLAEIQADLLLGARFTSNRYPDFSFQQPFFAPYRIYPTSRWRPGEAVKQRCNILVPEEAPSGGYNMTLDLLVQKGMDFEGRLIYREPEAFFLQ